MLTNERFFIEAADVDCLEFDWGKIWITIGPRASGAKLFSAGIVELQPGGGHSRHNHPGAEEIIHVIEGEGEQMVEDTSGRPITNPVAAGTSIFVPESRYHSTTNTGNGRMLLYVVYSPVGPEEFLRTLPGLKVHPNKR